MCTSLLGNGAREQTCRQMLVVLISQCREIQGSGGTTPSFMASRGKMAQGSSRAPSSTAVCMIQAGNGGTADSWAGRKGNKYLAPAFGRKPDEAFLSRG